MDSLFMLLEATMAVPQYMCLVSTKQCSMIDHLLAQRLSHIMPRHLALECGIEIPASFSS